MTTVDIEASGSTWWNQRNGVPQLVWTSPSVGYCLVVVNDFTPELKMYKTADSGASWTEQDTANNPSDSNARAFSLWFDQWTPGNSGTVIHIGWQASSQNDVQYHSFDTSDDTWGTQVEVATAKTVSTTSQHSWSGITVARSGRIYLLAHGDNTQSDGDQAFYYSDNGGTTWSSIAVPWSDNVQEQFLGYLMPGFETDDDDIIAIWMDFWTDAYEAAKYDASADSWGTAVELFSTVGFLASTAEAYSSFFDVALRHSDEQILIAAWNDIDTTTADLKFGVIDPNPGGTIGYTAKTDVVSNSDDCVCAGILINQQNDDIYVAYIGDEDGSETWLTTVDVYYKKSTDGGTTWGTQQAYSTEADDIQHIRAGHMVLDAGGRFMPVWCNDDLTDASVDDGNDVEIAAAAGGGGTLPERSYPRGTLRGVTRGAA